MNTAQLVIVIGLSFTAGALITEALRDRPDWRPHARAFLSRQLDRARLRHKQVRPLDEALRALTNDELRG